jgi:hypothetical protein
MNMPQFRTLIDPYSYSEPEIEGNDLIDGTNDSDKSMDKQDTNDNTITIDEKPMHET